MGSSAGELYKPLGAFLGRSRANGIASGRGDFLFPCYVRFTHEFCEAAHVQKKHRGGRGKLRPMCVFSI